MQEPTQRFTEDAMPALHRVQLRRGLPQACKEPGDAHIGSARLALLAVRAADRQRDLSSVPGLSALWPAATTAGWWSPRADDPDQPDARTSSTNCKSVQRCGR